MNIRPFLKVTALLFILLPDILNARISVNDILVTPPASQSGLELSPQPSVEEIFGLSFFPEPLVPVGRMPTMEENHRLADMLKLYVQDQSHNGMGLLSDYLAQHPASPWRVALWVNLGILHYKGGYFSKAMAAWEQAWDEGKNARNPQAKAVVDRAVGELVRMHARVGHTDRLEALFGELNGRNLMGSATEFMAGAQHGLWMMRNEPGVSFLCGPMALKNILQTNKFKGTDAKPVENARSGRQGFSLQQVQDLAIAAKLPLKMAKRKPGATLPLPAVAHWKIDHYAALVEQKNGLYHLKDPTFGDDLWITPEALEYETSGYYLIASQGQLPPGWETVGAVEAQKVHGMGFTGESDPGSSNPDATPCPTCPKPGKGGMARYDLLAMLVSVRISDIPVQFNSALGPKLAFSVSYNQRDASQPANLNFSNLGTKWSHNWLAYVEDSPSNLQADVILVRAGGGYQTFNQYNPFTREFAVEPKSQAILTRTQDSPAIYKRILPDGSQEIYSVNTASSLTRKVFLSKVIDPQGNAVALAYDTQRRLASLTDSTGKMMLLEYGEATDPFKITKVTDPTGRFAAFAYHYADFAGNPCEPGVEVGCKATVLRSITDTIGIVSSFRYNYGTDLINSMVTPYGTSTFDFGASFTQTNGPLRWIVATDPMGNKERLEFRHNAPSIPASEPAVPQGVVSTNDFMQYRNTFYWDKRATALACKFGDVTQCDYQKAQLYHWLHNPNNFNSIQDGLESYKAPLENRVWFNYPGQDGAGLARGTLDQPTAIAKILSDGTTQLKQYTYNKVGLKTREVDPSGRTRFYEYAANNIDLLRVWQKNQAPCDILAIISTGCDLQASVTYDTKHNPLTYQDEAGQITTYGYNALGQLTRITNALGQRTDFIYGTNTADPNFRRLVQISHAGKVISQLTYTSAGQIATMTDAGVHVLSFTYDNLDRLLSTTYPDGTKELNVYNRLDLASTTDRLKRVTKYAYNALGQPTQIVYPKKVGDPDRIIKLDWCPCDQLIALTDAKGQKTRWSLDLQGRVAAKFYPDNNSASPDESYVYDKATGLLQATLKQRNPGPALQTSYQYFADDSLRRIIYDVTHIKAKATPSVTFGYDPVYPRLISMVDGIGTTRMNYYPAGVLGAGKVKDEDGPWANDTIRFVYDILGRVQTRTINNQGNSQWTYDALQRLIAESNPLGRFDYRYLGNTPQLSQIDTRLPSSTLTGLRTVLTYGTNLQDRRLLRLENLVGNGATKTPLSVFGYAYDKVGNITRWSQQQKGQAKIDQTYQYDTIDQLLAVNPVTAASGKSYSYTYDLADNRESESVDGVVTSEVSNELNQIIQRGTGTFQYDDGGNQISDIAKNKNYLWDGADQMISVSDITTPGNRSDFAYDGLGRMRSVREFVNGALTSEKRYVWCGLSRCEERNGANAVTKRYYNQGELRGTTPLYYSRDHLGSVRELTEGNGIVRTQYSYDPWGRVTKLAGNLDSDFRYTGHYYHTQSSLHLAPFRSYGFEIGRWLKRDPIVEEGGFNLFGYSHNNPINKLDFTGLSPAENIGQVAGILIDPLTNRSIDLLKSLENDADRIIRDNTNLLKKLKKKYKNKKLTNSECEEQKRLQDQINEATRNKKGYQDGISRVIWFNHSYHNFFDSFDPVWQIKQGKHPTGPLILPP